MTMNHVVHTSDPSSSWSAPIKAPDMPNVRGSTFRSSSTLGPSSLAFEASLEALFAFTAEEEEEGADEEGPPGRTLRSASTCSGL